MTIICGLVSLLEGALGLYYGIDAFTNFDKGKDFAQ
jgi:hypothetical protein